MDNFILVQMRDELLPMKGNRGGDILTRGDFQKSQTLIKIVFSAPSQFLLLQSQIGGLSRANP